MKKILLITLVFVFTITSANLFAQKEKSSKKANPKTKEGHELVFNIKNAKDSIVYLTIHYRDKLMLKDSVRAVSPGKYIFKGDNTYEDGLYTLVSAKKIPYLNFIIDHNQHFEYDMDTSYNVTNYSVINSPENSEMLSFQKKTSEAQKNATLWQNKLKEFQFKGIKDSIDYYSKKLDDINTEMLDFIKALIDRNPNFLFSKMQKAYLPIDVPEPPVRADGTIDSNFQAIYYRHHYWDNVDLSDNRFIFLPVLEMKFNEYFKKILVNLESDTINYYVDIFLKKIETDSLMYRYFVDLISYQFETSKTLGHDAVFVHIAKNNQLQNKCKWLDESMIKKYEKRVNNLEPLLIGKPAVELLIPDTSGKVWFSSHKLKEKYVILWFFDPDCQTCQKESKKLKILYDSLTNAGTRNFEIYSIGNDCDNARLKRYVEESHYPWIIVGGNVANVDYLSVYNIHETGNPSMFILNEKREIILNKRIEISKIPEFLQQYEKIQELKAKRQK